MLCKNCNMRYADFPEKDFKFVPSHGKLKMFFSRITFNLIKRNGWYPRHKDARTNRIRNYMSDENGFCSEDCKRYYKLKEYPLGEI